MSSVDDLIWIACSGDATFGYWWSFTISQVIPVDGLIYQTKNSHAFTDTALNAIVMPTEIV